MMNSVRMMRARRRMRREAHERWVPPLISLFRRSVAYCRLPAAEIVCRQSKKSASFSENLGPKLSSDGLVTTLHPVPSPARVRLFVHPRTDTANAHPLERIRSVRP